MVPGKGVRYRDVYAIKHVRYREVPLYYVYDISENFDDISIQWNLSIADMLSSGHLSIADTFSRNQLSPAMVKPLYIEPLYGGHLSIADTFFKNQWCPLLRGSTVILQRLKGSDYSANISVNCVLHIQKSISAYGRY